ncbi:recombination regulator RecX [uncultured Xylophilus sp.]|uniref:recombination regulator RecX n=1 Tax=uncultured Xylophilus sp. TaxID=296832 RepID=UPI0025D4AA6D|nr:recombination regulator RecX [uncultured Xylophilus sp.]
MAFGTLSLKGRALRHLSRREHSRAELQQKLAPHAETPEELTRVLDELVALDFLNETRVVESVLRVRAPRLGAARVREELRRKGIAPEAIADAVAGLQDTELARAREAWARRFDAPPADARERARQGRFLLARGFSSGVVTRVLRQPVDTGEDGDAAG